MSDNARSTATSLPNAYQTRLVSRRHEYTADEPAEKQGGDTGMTPYELLTSALAACTAITVRMYAERKGWETGEIGVEVFLETEKGETHIKRELRFARDVPAEQRERLLMVANACPVHKVLTGRIQVETSPA